MERIRSLATTFGTSDQNNPLFYRECDFKPPEAFPEHRNDDDNDRWVCVAHHSPSDTGESIA